MFGPRGNPQARNHFGIIGYLQKQVASSSTSRRGQGDMGSRFRERKRATMHYFLIRTTRC